MKSVAIVLCLALVDSCCPVLLGPPGDVSSLYWKPQQRSHKETIIDCGGKSIKSLEIRTSNTTVKNCIVHGNIRIWGPAKNANNPVLKEASRQSDYVSWLRNSAPTNVRIENSEIRSEKTIPLYIGPGVTFTTIDSVKIKGVSVSTMVYLGAESHHTTISNTIIDASKAHREAIAIDASDHNIIDGNLIIHNNGGVFLYRNCGENGVIRHTTPSYNTIKNTLFLSSNNSEIAINIGSREGDRCYCSQDAGFSFGSSQSDLDHARFNTINNNHLGGQKILESNYSGPNKIYNNK